MLKFLIYSLFLLVSLFTFQCKSKKFLGSSDSNDEIRVNYLKKTSKIAFEDAENPKQNLKIEQKIDFDKLIYRFEGYFENKEIERIKTFFEKSLINTIDFIQNFTQKKIEQNLTIVIYESIEKKTLKTKNPQSNHFDFKTKTFYTTSNAYTLLKEEEGIQSLFLKLLLEKPYYKSFEEGLATYLTPNWQAEGFYFWAKQFIEADYPFSFKILLNDALYLAHSDYIRKSYAALWVAYLIEQYGKTTFLTYYSQNQPFEEFFDFKYILKNYRSAKNQNHINKNLIKKLPFLKGFNFAHEGYQVYNGYMGHLILPSLDRLKNLNVNTIAIVPYTYMANPEKPTPLKIPKEPGAENDQSVLFTNFMAKEKGFITMLKPQIWLRNSWPGDIEMKSSEDWKTFFDYYRRWILHYAFISQKHEIDLFCIGVEMTKVAVEHPDFWRKLIKDVQKIYKGKITYAANWYKAFEYVEFWNMLDYVSINFYFPLSQEANPTKTTLKKNFIKYYANLQIIAQRYKKPLLFTEIGFRSSETPWINPHAVPKNGLYSPDNQSLCYETVLEVLQEQNNYAGIYWWKWPSYLEYSQHRLLSFTPCQKPAEKIISEAFK